MMPLREYRRKSRNMGSSLFLIPLSGWNETAHRVEHMHGTFNVAKALRIKTKIEIEKLLHWAYRDELSKRMTSSAEGIWDKIAEDGKRGGIDPGHGAAQRYSHFGLPHRDAEWIEKAVSSLPDATINWDREAERILGPLVNLVDPRSRQAVASSPVRTPVAGWTTRDGRIRREIVDRPRDVIMVRSLRTSALVTMHATMGNRPDWREDQPRPQMISRGSKVVIVGECRGKNLYTTGSYCPLEYVPSPLAIAEARADYLAWWRGLKRLVESDLLLEDFEPLMPEAVEMPWITPDPVMTLVSPGTPRKFSKLPLGPERKLAGPRKRFPKGGEVRVIRP